MCKMQPKYEHMTVEVSYNEIPTCCDEYSDAGLEFVSFCKHPQKDKWVLIFRSIKHSEPELDTRLCIK